MATRGYLPFLAEPRFYLKVDFPFLSRDNVRPPVDENIPISLRSFSARFSALALSLAPSAEEAASPIC